MPNPRLNHQEAESIADCIIAYTFWRAADEELLTRPSPEAKRFERECYAIWEKYPDAVQTEAQILVHRRAA